MENYTTSSLVYAAAAIEQGFEGCEYRYTNEGQIKWIKGNDYAAHYWRFPKKPHNVALMELQMDDVAQVHRWHAYTDEEQPASVIMMPYMRISIVELRDRLRSSADYTIILRNNKPFPVWDKESSS